MYWVFGYGSLVWKVDFPYEKRQPGYIRGFVRRFWQHSTDHRGTPASPGRVATLVPHSEWTSLFSQKDPHAYDLEKDICWGVAYKIAERDVAFVREHLDFREKDGYSTLTTQVFHPTISLKNSDGSLVPLIDEVLVYIAASSNPNFAGPLPIEELGREIATKSGPSGRNSECRSLQL